AEDGIRDRNVTGVQTCALPIFTFQVSGMTSGIKIPIVPQLVPVANEIKADSTKMRAGINPAGIASLRAEPKNSAVCNTSVVCARDHANSSTIIAKSIDLRPSYHDSTVSSKVKIRWPTDITAATITLSREPHIKAEKESASPIISRIDAFGPAEATPVV